MVLVRGINTETQNITLEFKRYFKAFISITINIANTYYFGKENVYRVKDFKVDWDLFTM